MFLEQLILWFFLILSIIILVICLRKPGTKDWIIIFSVNAMLTVFIDAFIVKYGFLEYPIRFFSDVFETSLLFNMVVFPILCVLYNQTSYESRLFSIIGQAGIYSLFMSIIEFILERNTDVITYYTWTIYHTFFTLMLTFLLVRFIISLIRKYEVGK